MATTATTANATPRPRTERRRAVLWTLAAAAITGASQWGVVVALSKVAPPATLGELALGLALASPVFLFVNLQLRSLLVIDCKGRFADGHYLTLRAATSVLGLAAVAALAAVAGSGAQRPVIVAAGVWKAVDGLGDILGGVWQRAGRMEVVALSAALKGALALAAIVGTIRAGGPLWAGVLAAALLSGLVVCYVDARPAAGKLEWNAPPLRTLAIQALPLGLMTALVSLNANVPRYVVEQSLGTAALGVLAAIGALPTAGNLLVNALGQAAQPALARQAESRDRRAFGDETRRLLGWGLVPGVVGVTAAALAGRELLAVLYRPEYGAFAELLVWQMSAAALGWVSSLAGYAATALREFPAQLWMLASVACVTAGSSVWLVPRGGLRGAGIALVLASGWQLSGSLWVLARGCRRLD